MKGEEYSDPRLLNLQCPSRSLFLYIRKYKTSIEHVFSGFILPEGEMLFQVLLDTWLTKQQQSLSSAGLIVICSNHLLINYLKHYEVK